MENLLDILRWTLTGAAAAGFLWVIVQNWRVLVLSIRRPQAPRPSLILLAGPVLLVILVQGLRTVGLVDSGLEVLAVVVLGLILDPAALPLVTAGVVRAFRNREGA